MMQVNESVRTAAAMPSAPVVRYVRGDPREVLATAGTLAVFGFGSGRCAVHEARYVSVPLEPAINPGAGQANVPLEVWSVQGPVQDGSERDLAWSAGNGWLLVTVHVHEAEAGGLHDATAYAYQRLLGFIASREENHVQRVWNYLEGINAGRGDNERYKRFCAGRADGMGDYFADGFPAATAIGHRRGDGSLQVYALACTARGSRVENPRQLSAWRYPPQYGSTPPRFARAMRLPGNDALAISGTAAIIGHQSQHDDDLHAQLDETLINLHALLGGDGEDFDIEGVLKVYVRRAQDVPAVDAVLAERTPRMSRLLLLGDICRSELLVEIDGWRYGSRPYT